MVSCPVLCCIDGEVVSVDLRCSPSSSRRRSSSGSVLSEGWGAWCWAAVSCGTYVTVWSTWRSLFLWRSPSLPWSTRCRSRLWCGYCLERSGPLAIGRSTCFGFDCGKSTWSDCRSLLCLQVSSQPLRQRFGVSPANATDAWISSVLDESGPGPCSCSKNSWRRNKSSWPHLPALDTTSGSGVVGVQWNDQIY